MTDIDRVELVDGLVRATTMHGEIMHWRPTEKGMMEGGFPYQVAHSGRDGVYAVKLFVPLAPGGLPTVLDIIRDVPPGDGNLGRIAYEAYAGYTGGQTFDARTMPTWYDLSGRTPSAWRVAAAAVVEAASRLDGRQPTVLEVMREELPGGPDS